MMLDFNHNATKPTTAAGDLTVRINRLIGTALQAEDARRPKRDYLGASLIGEPCLRKIQYSYQATGPSTYSGKTLRIFKAGHVFEEMSAEELRLAGFDLRTHDKNGEQFGFEVAGGKIAGHIDGVLCGGPVAMAYPALWEHKALGPKSWNEVVKKGVAVAKPVYAAQLALYQAYLDLTENPAVFTARNRDTQEIYHEPVPFDAALAQRMSDKAVQIIQASELLPRIAQDRSFWMCRFCEHAEKCWRET